MSAMRWSLVALLLCPLLDLGQGVSYSNHWSTLVPAGRRRAAEPASRAWPRSEKPRLALRAGDRGLLPPGERAVRDGLPLLGIYVHELAVRARM